MTFGSEGPNFGTLQDRLLAHVRALIRDGELTERGLARMIGMSQPHVHNVLKGARALTPEVADLILSRLGVSVLEMASSTELGETLERIREYDTDIVDVPVLRGRLSARDPFPDAGDVEDWLRIAAAGLHPARRPALVPIQGDIEEHWPGASMALLDLDEAQRARPAPPSWYAIRWCGGGYIRQVARERTGIRVLGQRSLEPPAAPDLIPVDRMGVLSVVRARVLWVGPDLRYTPVLRHIGAFLDVPAST